uniref:Uncharacterized protein n=1 Tax=Anguilla anguilla TaxID=7936 RepID=A0A0E9WQX2_ANGAN
MQLCESTEAVSIKPVCILSTVTTETLPSHSHHGNPSLCKSVQPRSHVQLTSQPFVHCLLFLFFCFFTRRPGEGSHQAPRFKSNQSEKQINLFHYYIKKFFFF